MKQTAVLALIIFCCNLSFGQDSKTVLYGSQSYIVHLSANYIGNDFKSIEITEEINFYAFIVKMIKDKEIDVYKTVDEGATKKVSNDVSLNFVTREGYNACQSLPRKYVSLTIDDEIMFLIHQDEFDKVMMNFMSSKHLQLCQKFLYTLDITEFTTITFVSN